jgi:hypothetical protein
MKEKEVGSWECRKYEQVLEWGKERAAISQKCVKYFVTNIHVLLNIQYS